MEAEQEIKRENNSLLIVMKHSCKFCHKRFPCGRSLGGHMKSHLITNPIDQEKVNTSIIKHHQKQQIFPTTTNSSSGELSYELRESPKKTWRAIGSTQEDSCDQDPNLHQFQGNKSFCCKECGKAFHSSKALSGHMKSHSIEREKEKERLILVKENRFLDDLNSYNNGPRRSSRKPRNMGLSTNDGNNNNNKNGSSSSSVSEIDDQQEQQEVALCLILLSRDLNSEFKETPPTIEEKGLNLFNRVWESELGQNLTSQNFLVQAEFAIETGKRKAKADDDDVLESDDKRRNFECTTCNKIFHSHQALGGHRASHKKTKGCFGKSEIQAPPVFQHHSQEKEICSRKVVEKHECPICCRVFPSGQALGGHKRSHFIVKSNSKFKDYSVEKSITTTTTTNSTSTHEARDFLDLNQPAPVEVEVVGLKPWWVENTSKHEQLLGMI